MSEVLTVQCEQKVRVSRCMAMLMAGASLLPHGAASEVCEKGELTSQGGSSMFGDVGWLVLLAGLVCILHMVKDLGLEVLKRLIVGKESLKVKLLDDEATLPQKGSPGAAGWDISTAVKCQLAPGERKLISTGLAFEIPRGLYGRLAARSSLASRGLDVAGGVIDADYRGEVKVILVNHGEQTASFEVGDRIAQIIFEKVSEAPMREVKELSRTIRGGGAFGSSGVGVRSLRVEKDPDRVRQTQEGELQPRDPRVPEGGLQLRDPQVPEGGLHSRVPQVHDRELQPRGSQAREGGPSDRDLRVPEGAERTEAFDIPLPTRLDFEVMTSRGGESMAEFLNRVRGQELQSVFQRHGGEDPECQAVQWDDA